MIKNSESLYVILVGCGRVGAHLATVLSEEGHAVVVIDSDADSFNGIGGRLFRINDSREWDRRGYLARRRDRAC